MLFPDVHYRNSSELDRVGGLGLGNKEVLYLKKPDHITTNMLFQIWDLTTVLSCPLLNPIRTSPLFILWNNGFTTFSLYVLLF